MSKLTEHALTVTRTARYCTLGGELTAPAEVWFVCHGYGQLAPRFLRDFEAMADGTRLMVAPEGLSRFYLETAPGGSHSAKVGASWMTREARESEIEDYLGFLETLHDQVFSRLSRAAVRMTLLGFSQGVATAARWSARGRIRADQLVLWGGVLPPDLDPASDPPVLNAGSVAFVAGRQDRFLDSQIQEQQAARIRAGGTPCRVIRFDGGHQIDPRVLGELAGTPESRPAPNPGNQQ